MNNSYFNIFTSLSEATIIVKIVLLILLFLSIYSWSVIFSKIRLLIKYNRLLKRLYNYTKQNSDNVNYVIESFSKHKNNTYSTVLKFFVNNKSILFKNDSINPIVINAVDNFLYESDLNLENKLSYLATIGTISPFIGLFGTVFGVINSFEAIGINSSASLATIAPGIAEALYATAFGLFVAIPAVFSYNTFTNKIEKYKELQNILLQSMLLSVYKNYITDSDSYNKSSINESAFRSLDFLQEEKKTS